MSHRTSILTAFMLLVLGAPALAGSQILNEVQKFTIPPDVSNENFGTSVAVDGDVAVFGAPQSDGNVDFSGAAYVYRYNGTDWQYEQQLIASDGMLNEQLGVSVSVSGDVILLGAQGYEGLLGNEGAAYVYRWDGANWVEEQKLLSPAPFENESFGQAVSILGDIAVIGNGPGSGGILRSAYVFRYNGMSWFYEAELQASDGVTGDGFSESLSVHGSVIAVGARTGQAAYVFRFDGASWFEEQKLAAFGGVMMDTNFGHSVAVNGESLVVGADGSSENGFNAGSAYVFRYEGGDWLPEQKLLSSDGEPGDSFGASVAIEGDTVIVGDGSFLGSV